MKYKAVVQQQTLDQTTMSEQSKQIEDLISENENIRSQVADLQMKLQGYEDHFVDKQSVVRLENRIRDIESRLELEQTQKHRLEVQLTRQKDQLDKVTEEKEATKSAKIQVDDVLKRAQRQLRELREEFSEVQKKEMEASHKAKEMETRASEMETDFIQNQSYLKLAFKRIADLQAALEEGLDDSDDSLYLDSDEDTDEDDDFLTNHNASANSPRLRSSSGASGSSKSTSSPRLSRVKEYSET